MSHFAPARSPREDVAATPGRGAGCCLTAEAAWIATENAETPAAVTFRAHVADCAACAAAYAAACRTVCALRALPAVAGGDVVDAVLARLPSRMRWNWRRFAGRAAAAAAGAAAGAVLLAAVLRDAHPPTPPATPAPARIDPAEEVEVVVEVAEPGLARRAGLAWLAHQQRADGTWDVAALGGRPEHAPALNGLALLALRDAEPTPDEDALRRGAAALLAMQAPDGGFGNTHGFQMYNHGIATVALLRLRQAGYLTEDAAPALDRALDFIRAAQRRDGGWGYRAAEFEAPANASVTAWQVLALGLANRAGGGDPRGHLRRGIFWLSRLADARGVLGYRQSGDWPSARLTNTALGLYCVIEAGQGIQGIRPIAQALARGLAGLLRIEGERAPSNPYRDFFVTRARAAWFDARYGTRQLDVEPLRRRLAAEYERQGHEQGSWSPRDAYGRIGGRLYATALASMALR